MRVMAGLLSLLAPVYCSRPTKKRAEAREPARSGSLGGSDTPNLKEAKSPLDYVA